MAPSTKGFSGFLPDGPDLGLKSRPDGRAWASVFCHGLFQAQPKPGPALPMARYTVKVEATPTMATVTPTVRLKMTWGTRRATYPTDSSFRCKNLGVALEDCKSIFRGGAPHVNKSLLSCFCVKLSMRLHKLYVHWGRVTTVVYLSLGEPTTGSRDCGFLGSS